MARFGIEETADGFILRRGDEEIRMSKEEFSSLKAQMNLWTERRLLEYQTRSGEVRQIVSHPIAWADVWPDAIQENVLLIEPNRDTGGLFPSDPDCGWACWCFGACSGIDAARSEGLDIFSKR
jgi:hypothetical protein